MRITESTPAEYSEPCHICGETASAMWMWVRAITVCPSCAIKYIPKLIADAIVLKPTSRSPLMASDALEKLKAVFWKAVVNRLAHEARSDETDTNGATEEEDDLLLDVDGRPPPREPLPDLVPYMTGRHPGDTRREVFDRLRFCIGKEADLERVAKRLESMAAAGKCVRSGSGKRSDPYRYFVKKPQ